MLNKNRDIQSIYYLDRMHHLLKHKIEVNIRRTRCFQQVQQNNSTDHNILYQNHNQTFNSNNMIKCVIHDYFIFKGKQNNNNNIQILKQKLKKTVSKNLPEAQFYKFMETANNSLNFSLSALPFEDKRASNMKKLTLCQPENCKKKILILDLDETLIHSVSEGQPFEVEVKIQDKYPILLNIRPGCPEFLQKMNEFFTIYVFTASTQQYAQSIIDYLNKDKTLIKGLITRKSCFYSKKGHFVKDLRIISNRGLQSIVIVDNLIHSFGFQLDNGIPIAQFIDDKNDRELKHVEDILMKIKDSLDVRVQLSLLLGLKDIGELFLQQNTNL